MRFIFTYLTAFPYAYPFLVFGIPAFLSITSLILTQCLNFHAFNVRVFIILPRVLLCDGVHSRDDACVYPGQLLHNINVIYTMRKLSD